MRHLILASYRCSYLRSVSSESIFLNTYIFVLTINYCLKMVDFRAPLHLLEVLSLVLATEKYPKRKIKI